MKKKSIIIVTLVFIVAVVVAILNKDNIKTYFNNKKWELPEVIGN